MLKKIAIVLLLLIGALLAFAATRPDSMRVQREAIINAPAEDIFPLITDALPPSRVTIKLDFIEPFEGHNVTEFALAPQGSATRVTWAMEGPSPYMAKLMGVFVDMNNLIGKDFESGLANLKTIAER